MGGRKYTEQEIAFVKEHYANEYSGVIAEKLGRTVSSIWNMATLYGLKKSKEFKSRQGREAAEAHYDEISKGWYKKGQVPHNKGKKLNEFMSAEGIKRSKLTRFKKGQLPHNTKHDGAVSWRKENTKAGGYYYLRLRKSYWVLLHRYLWEQVRGPIPEGMNVQFKDGNSRNCTIENLELVSKGENMQRNTLHQWQPLLKEQIKLINKINKKIHDYEHRK